MATLPTAAYQNSNSSNLRSIGRNLILKIISAFKHRTRNSDQNTQSATQLDSIEQEAQISPSNRLEPEAVKNNTPEKSQADHTHNNQPGVKEPKLTEQHLTFTAGDMGISYHQLFGEYLKDAKHIEVTDPYIRNFYQARNLMEFLELVMQLKAPSEEVAVQLTTVEDYDLIKANKLKNYLDKIESEMQTVGIKFSYAFDNCSQLHARHITTDTGWKISLDRGLDIFQPYNMTDAFQLMHRHQEVRPIKAFEVTYIEV